MMYEFKTYWIVDCIKHTNYQIVKKLVEKGQTAIEISAAKQQIAAQNRKANARADAILDEQIRKAAAEREHLASPEGKRQDAIRVAQQNPGGVVSGGQTACAELDEYLPHKTNLLR